MQKYPFLTCGMLALFQLWSSVSFSTSSPIAVMERYFEAVKSHSVEDILSLFTANAKISTAASEIQGLEKIRDFYLNGVLKCKEFNPEHGPYLLGNDMIGVEIVLNCDGVKKSVGDFFTIHDDKISHMRVYSGPGYQPS